MKEQLGNIFLRCSKRLSGKLLVASRMKNAPKKLLREVVLDPTRTLGHFILDTKPNLAPHLARLPRVSSRYTLKVGLASPMEKDTQNA